MGVMGYRTQVVTPQLLCWLVIFPAIPNMPKAKALYTWYPEYQTKEQP